jgi:hypothetical protein
MPSPSRKQQGVIPLTRREALAAAGTVLLAGSIAGIPGASALTPMLSAEVIVYPAPNTPGFPGDFSTVAHLKQSADYTVKVNGQACFVYETENYWKHKQARDEKKAAFTSFAFRGGPVSVTVESAFPATAAVIRPKSAGIAFTQKGNILAFTMDSPRKLCVEINGRSRPLFIIGEAPDEPDTSATHYFGPGVHKIGRKKEIRAGERVYIAAGAVVEGTFQCAADNIKVRGRGILSSGCVPWEDWLKDGSNSMFSYRPKGQGTANHHEYEGLFLLNTPGWYGYGDVNQSTIRNIKMIAWCGNSDGFHLGGKSVMEDCFIFNNDDALIGHNGTDNTWRDCVVSKGVWGHCIASFKNNWVKTDVVKGFVWENIDIIGGASTITPVIHFYGNFPKNDPGGGTMTDCAIRNLRIEAPRVNPLIKLRAIKYSIRNLLIENVIAESALGGEGEITSSGDGGVDGIQFRNLKIGGRRITDLETSKIRTSGSVSRLSFAP